MATTAMYVEILIIGLQSLAWLVFLLASIFGVKGVSINDSVDWVSLIIILVLATSYILGIFIDRIADTMFNKLLKASRRFGAAEFFNMRLTVLAKNNAVAKFLDYQRSRLRIARASSINLIFIIIFGSIFLFTQTNVSTFPIVLTILIGVVLLVISVVVTFKINSAQDITIEYAFNVLNKLPLSKE